MAIDNPWPDRQDSDDNERGKHQAYIERWIARNTNHVIEIVAQILELKDEFRNKFDADMDDDIQSFFGITRQDVQRWEGQRRIEAATRRKSQ